MKLTASVVYFSVIVSSLCTLSSTTLRYDYNTIIGKKTKIRSIRQTIIIILIISFILSNFFDNALNYWYHFGTYVIVSSLIPLISTLFNIKTINFLIGSILGMTPQLFVWTSLGSGIEKIIDENLEAPSFSKIIFSQEIYLPIIAFVILLILGIFAKKKIIKK